MPEIEIVVTARNNAHLDKIGAEAKRTGKQIGDDLERGFRNAEQAGERATTSLRKRLSDLGGSGKGIGQSLTDSISGGLGKTGGIAAAGALIGGALLEGVQTVWEQDRVGALIAAQTGAAAGQAKALGSAAGDMFRDGFGASIEDVGQAMSAAIQSGLVDVAAPIADIQRMTEKVIVSSQVMGESFNDVARAAQQAVRTGLADSTSEALDLITHATQQGLNVAGDLLDTVSEYGTTFRKVGLEGADSMGLLSQAQKAGARDTDQAADAIKEFGIRAQETSGLTKRGFEAIGLDASKMSEMVARGGDSARTALDMTLDALRAMPPSVERNTAAVDLFGAKAEDLGAALFSMDLDTAADQFGDFAGSVEEAAQKLEGGQSALDRLGKGLAGAAEGAAEGLMSLADLGMSEELLADADAAKQLQVALDQYKSTGSAEYLEELAANYPELADAIDGYIESTDAGTDATKSASEAAGEFAETLGDVISAQQEAAGIALSLSEAEINTAQALADAQAAAAENGATLDLNTEAGRKNRSALNDLAEASLKQAAAMDANGQSTAAVTGFVGRQRAAFIASAQAMGMSAKQANALADQLNLIPRTTTARIIVQTDQARAMIASLTARINSIPNRVVNLRVNTTYSGMGGHVLAGQESGGVVGAGVWGAASGGERHSTTMINEAGPEVVELPTGSRVMTAGATRALAESGAFGGGGGVGVLRLEMGSAPDSWLGDLFHRAFNDNIIRLTAGGQRVTVA